MSAFGVHPLGCQRVSGVLMEYLGRGFRPPGVGLKVPGNPSSAGVLAGVLACEFTGRPARCPHRRRDAARTRSRDGCAASRRPALSIARGRARFLDAFPGSMHSRRTEHMVMRNKLRRLSRAGTGLLVVDHQERLLPAIHERERVIRNYLGRLAPKSSNRFWAR